MEHSHKLGMPIHNEPVVVYQRRGQSPRDMFGSIRQKNCNLQLIMVVLPKKEAGSGYGTVKHMQQFPCICSGLCASNRHVKACESV